MLRLGNSKDIWKDNGRSMNTKICLDDVIVLSTLLYGKKAWPMTVEKIDWSLLIIVG